MLISPELPAVFCKRSRISHIREGFFFNFCFELVCILPHKKMPDPLSAILDQTLFVKKYAKCQTLVNFCFHVCWILQFLKLELLS